MKKFFHKICLILLLIVFSSSKAICAPEIIINTDSHLTEEQKKVLKKIMEDSQKQKLDIPQLKDPTKLLSEKHKKEIAQSVQQAKKPITPEMQNSVKEILNSDQFKANEIVGENIAKETMSPLINKYYGKPPILTQPARPEGQVLVFVSSSMPIQTLRNYARALSKINGALVLRGGISGLKKIGPTLAFSQLVLKKTSHCTQNCHLFNVILLIDPLLFRQYHITQVPAIVFRPNGIVSECNNASVKTEHDVDIIYGDVSLSGALIKLNQLTPHPILNDLINFLEKTK